MRYSGLDLLKFIAAFGIVGCHLALSEKTVGANIIMRLTDINVGIFAAISGFFIAMGLEKSLSLREAIQKRALRLLPIYLVWTGVYLIASTVLGRHFERLTDIGYLTGAIFQGGASCHLWYLIALFYFTSIVLTVNYFLPRICKNSYTLMCLSFACLYVSTLGDYTFWWGYYFSRLAAFALLGMALWHARGAIEGGGCRWLLVLSALLGVAFRLWGAGGAMNKFVLDYIAAVMILPVFILWPLSSGNIERKLADISLGIYLVHPLIAMVVGMIAKRWISGSVDIMSMMAVWLVVWSIAIVATTLLRRLPFVRSFV